MIPSRHQDIEIPEAHPFANDALGRERYAYTFESIVSVYAETGCVIALNGEWGVGKTTFVRMMQQDMKNKGYHPLYFNAWTNDFVSDPLVALLSEIKEIFPKTEKLEKVLQTGSKIMIDVVASAAKSIIKNKVGVDIEDVTDNISKDLKNGIDEYAKQKKAFEDFKQALQEYVTDNTVDSDKPVVFFVDELDRCNPHFAVQVLERIKHLFDIPNIVFVIVINKRQLCHAVHGYYGNSELDADNYLRRFIDVEFTLPNADLQKYCDVLYDAYNFDEVIQASTRQTNSRLHQDANSFQYIVKYLICSSDFDLRTTDKFMAYIRLALQSYGQASQIFPDVFLLLNYIKYVNADLYDRIRYYKLSINDLVCELDNTLGEMITKIQNQSQQPESLIGYIADLVFMYMTDLRVEFKSNMLEGLEIHYINKELFMRYLEQNNKYNYTCPGLKYIVEHIEIQNGIAIYD